jgi:1-acyl-sn-glycerol-3-phosphate acyltransferase
MSGDISVDRRSKKSRAQVLTTASEYLSKRCSVMFFPEGTRSRDGRVHRFSDGAFRLAIEKGVPVLPIAIDGTHEALPKHSIWFDPNPETIRVKVLDPVDTDPYAEGEARALQRHVRAKIIQQVATWRGMGLDEADGRSDTEAAATKWIDAGPGPWDGNTGEIASGEASVKPSAHPGASEPGG